MQTTLEQLDPCEWESLRPHYEELRDRSIATATDLEQWIKDRSRLDSVVAEAQANLYIATTRNTEDQQAQARRKHFLESVAPAVERISAELDRKLVGSPLAPSLDEYYRVLLRNARSEVEIFRDENVELLTRDQLLSQEYNKIIGGMQIEWEGGKKPLVQVYAQLEAKERDVRERAWRAIFGRLAEESQKLQTLLDDLVANRTLIAKNAGFSNFREFQFKRLHRFDYGPKDCAQFRESVKQFVVPIARDIDKRRCKALGLPALRPWDVRADIEGKAPLKPFDDVAELTTKLTGLFHDMGPWFGGVLQEMQDRDELDLESRPHKAPGGYQSQRSFSGRPFIFQNAVGRHGDLMTLIHEAGHAFHTILRGAHPVLEYRYTPHEFSEVASMGMELMAFSRLTRFYSGEDARRAWRNHLETIVSTICSVAMIDGFQDLLYITPDHTHSERDEHFYQLQRTYGAASDDSGVEDLRMRGWQLVPHIFRTPYYYIEYGIAQLGALQLWLKFREDEAAALEGYKRALALGGSRPLPELFEAAGIRFDFGASTFEELMQHVQTEIARAQ